MHMYIYVYIHIAINIYLCIYVYVYNVSRKQSTSTSRPFFATVYKCIRIDTEPLNHTNRAPRQSAPERARASHVALRGDVRGRLV